MDINELQEGTTIFIPVFLKGALVWTGELALPPGNGEVNLTALEWPTRDRHAAHRRKDLNSSGAHREPDPLDHHGLRQRPEQAMVNAVREAVDMLAAQKTVPLTATRRTRSCRGGRLPRQPGGGRAQGVHCMIPKAIFATKSWLCARPSPSSCWPPPPPGRRPAARRHNLHRPQGARRGGGGDRVAVEAWPPPSTPARVEVRPGQLRRLQAAQLLVRIGLDHEPWLARALRT